MRRLGYFLLGFAAVVFMGGVAQAAMEEDEGGEKKFTIHGEVRFRGEWWNNLTDFTDTDADPDGDGVNDSTDNDSFDIFPYRITLAAKGDLGHDIWVYGAFQGSGVAGGGLFGEVSPFFGDDFEAADSGVNLYQGWVKAKDVGDSVLDLTFGRQEIVFDTGLHFSNLPYYNGISHDGVMAAWDWDNFGVHAFWIQPFESNLFATDLDQNSDADDNTLGVHFKHMLGDNDQDVAYYLFLQIQDDFDLSDVDPITGGVQRGDKGKIYTAGARWGHKVEHGKGGFGWNLEGSYQFGDFQPCAAGLTTVGGFIFGPGAPACVEDTLDMKAWVLEGSLGYTWSQGKTDQKLWGGLTWASGDDDPADEDMEAFMPLYNDFHRRLGYADLFAVTNIESYNIGYKVNVDERHIFGGTFWLFNQAETETGTVSPLTFVSTGETLADSCVSGGGVSCDDDLGQELDLFYDYNLTENFSFDLFLAWFEPGQAIEDHWSGFGAVDAGEDAAWRFNAQARARF